MKTDLNLFKMTTLMWLTLITIILTIGQATAANRIFPLYLKNGFDHDITFKIEMGNCYQGTGYYDPKNLIQGPIPPGGRVKIDVAVNRNHGCPKTGGSFFVKTTDPRYQAGKGQSFYSNDNGHLSRREGSEEFSGHLSAKNARDESYTWTIVNPIPAIEPAYHNNRVIRIKNITSGEYLTQAHNGQRDDVRNVTVWPLPSTKNDSFRWFLQEAGDGQYWNLINLATGLALTWDGSGQNVSDWGITSSTNPNQLWRFERRKNRHMIINKATNQGLQQAHNGLNPSKRNVHIWPEQSFAGNGWAWSLEDGGAADLMKLHFEKIRCIKPSTGQDGATKILFFGIDAALQAGLAAATGGASAAGSAALAGKAVTKAAVLKAMKKEARKELRGTLQGEVEDRAKQAAWDQVNSNLPSEVNDLNERANREINRHTPNAVSTVLDTAETLESLTSIEGLFNKLYGESPDDVMLHVNGVAVWPAGGRNHVGMKSQQEFKMNLDYIFDRSNGLFVQLVEHDSGSNDDWLGSFGLNIQQLNKKERFVDVLIQSEDEGSIYEVTFTIGPYLTRGEEQLQVWQEMQKAKKSQQEEKNRLNQAEVDRKMAQAAITPFTATLNILGSENGLSRIPLNRYSENPEKLLISPAIYLNVTFANGSKSNAHYHLQAPDNVIFDDTSGDLNDLIKLVYTPGPNGTEIPGQVTATGNGVGIAELKVSFRNRPGLSASIYVEIVDTQPAVTQQVTTNPRAEFLNIWAAEQRAGHSFPYSVDVFKISQIYSRCPAGCEMVYQNEDVLIVMGMPDYAKSDVSMAEIDKRVSDIFLPSYCSSDNKKDNTILSFAVGDKYGARIVNTTFKPVDCEVAQTSAVNTPAPVAASNQTAELFNRLATGSRAEINLPFTADIFQMNQIYSICPTDCEMDYAESGLYVTMVMPDYAANDVSMEEIDARVGQVLGGVYCAGDVKKGNGIMLFAIDGQHGARMANTLFRPTDCNAANAIAPSQPVTQAPVEQQVEFVPSQAGIVATTGTISEVTQFALYNDWNFNWAVAWVDGNGTVTAGSQSIVPGGAWRIENGAKGWGWYTIYTTERYLCSFSPKQGASINISQLTACTY